MKKSRFVTVGFYADGSTAASSPNVEIPQLVAIATAEVVFETFDDVRTVKLYRVDTETQELVHVQTWTRDPAVAEAKG